MPLVATLIADGVIIDALTNRLSVLNLFDTWTVREVPGVLSLASVVTIYETEADRPLDHFERVRIVAPDGDTTVMRSLARIRSPPRGADGPFVHASVHFIDGVHVRTFGLYSIIVDHAASEEGPWIEDVRRSVLVRKPPEALPAPATPAVTSSSRPA